MKSLLDKDGNFVLTFEGGEIDLSDYPDHQVVEGDQPLVSLHNLWEAEKREELKKVYAARDAEMNALKDRISKLEGNE